MNLRFFYLCILIFLGFGSSSGSLHTLDTIVKIPTDDTSSWNLYLYVPVRFVQGPQAIQNCLSDKKYQAAQFQIFPSTIGYHISLGNYAITGRENARRIAKKIQEVVANRFLKFSAKLDKRHGGVTVFGEEPKKFVVMILKTDQKGGNQQGKLLFKIHKCIQQTALACEASAIGTLPFVPHCSISSYPTSAQQNFLKIKRDLLGQLTKIASENSLRINPNHLRYRIFHHYPEAA
jgi:hypothetical protein